MKKKRAFDSQRMKRFLETRGFYIALLACMLTLAVTGFVMTRDNMDGIGRGSSLIDSENDPTGADLTDVLAPVGDSVPDNTSDESDTLTYGDKDPRSGVADGDKKEEPAKAADKTPAKKSDTPPKTQKTASTSSTAPDKAASGNTGDGVMVPADNAGSDPSAIPAFSVSRLGVKPLNGEITLPFSGDELLYSKTFDDWRVHKGIDIKGSVGAEVRAMSDGKVADIYYDEMLGNVVVINHGGGLITVYAGLSPAFLVEKGQAVSAGQAIGSVGESGMAEAADGSHLHFEVILEGRQTDPTPYFTALG